MHPFTETELLNYWEYNMNQTMIHRGINLLCLVYTQINKEDISGLSIGERDARLIIIRERMFGYMLRNIAECPVCSEIIEWETDIRDIKLQSPDEIRTVNEYILKESGYTIQFRLPDSMDVFEVINMDESHKKSEELLKRLIICSKFKNRTCNFSDLPEKVLKVLDQRIEKENPQAEILMNVQCMSCNHNWELQFDILSYLWSEISNWARRILNDICSLAREYGWSEHDILSMTPARRKIYLDLKN